MWVPGPDTKFEVTVTLLGSQLYEHTRMHNDQRPTTNTKLSNKKLLNYHVEMQK